MSSAVQLPQRGSEARCNQCKMKFGGRKGVRKHGISTGHNWEPPIRCLVCGEGFSMHKNYKLHRPSCPASTRIAMPSTTVTVSSGVSVQSATLAPVTPKTEDPPPVATASPTWAIIGMEDKNAEIMCSCAMCARGSNSTGTGDQAASTNTDGTLALASSVASDRTVPPGLNMVPPQVNGASPSVAHSVHSDRSPEGSPGHRSSIGSFEEIESRTTQLSVSDPEFIETSSTGSTDERKHEDGEPPRAVDHTAEPQVAFEGSQEPTPALANDNGAACGKLTQAAKQGACTQESKPLSWHCRSCLRDACVEPMATVCGHIFCLQCIIKELEVNSACPACNKVFLVKLDVAL
ncbi:hypothetical protein FKP32DRAFT_1759607 [Trametes sanguinea]|nr:hypothetical protein FKP32DRAFT_1759607 [Trametes sanguinea]